MSILKRLDLYTLKQLDAAELEQLSQELRDELVACVSARGGHLASNLGVVELTIALHRVFDSPRDKIVWDVGHQSYVHKMLTGRLEAMKDLRTQGGPSGFPKRSESEHDSFGAGHASTAISAALGMARARDLRGQDHKVVAVVGDGALTGGMAFEALNDAGRTRKQFTVVINDNEMSIDKNVGAFAAHLNKVRSGSGYNRAKDYVLRKLESAPGVTERLRRIKRRVKYLVLPSVLFEELGFTYYGPLDGHDTALMEEYMRRAAALDRPVVIHVVTQKGKGYGPSERHPDMFHGTGPFDAQEGWLHSSDVKGNSAVAGETMVALAKEDPRIVAITAAMTQGTGLEPFEAAFRHRFFDVGIAEQHAVGMAAGMAVGGMRPFVAIYSTFLQRAYDQLLHDVCLQRLPVVVGVDRCGLVGEDGPTHHGAFDISYLLDMPGMQVYSPATQSELAAMLALAFEQEGPVAVRYPKMPLPVGEAVAIEHGKWELFGGLHEVMLVGTGYMVQECVEAARLLREQGIGCGVVNARFLKPMDRDMLHELAACKLIVSVEDGIASHGLGTQLTLHYGTGGPLVICLGLPEEPVGHGSAAQLYAQLGLDAQGIARSTQEALRGE